MWCFSLPKKLENYAVTMSAAPILSSNFDAGNGIIGKVERAADGSVNAELTIKQEPFTEGTDKKHHMQW